MSRAYPRALQIRPPGPAPARFVRISAPVRFAPYLLVYALHVPLGLLLSRFPVASTLHALATLLLGLWWAASDQKPDRIAGAGAYLVGSEVLWRMTEAHIFWEFGKYATAAIFLVAILRRRRWGSSRPILLYFALLLPSTALTLTALSPSAARGQISFNLSGPFALAVSAWFFSSVTLSRTQVIRLFARMLAPIVAVCAIALAGTAKVSSFTGSESSVETSGGFGPNQVSAMLGLGSLLAFLCTQEVALGRKLRVLMFAVTMVFAAQSALTFSRGGLYAAAGGALAAVFFLVREGKARWRAIGILAVCLLLANYLVLPRLDAFTGGAVSVRFADRNLTHREEIASSDFRIWLEHPILGVGPGVSRLYREPSLRSAAAHTEFSRLLSEHGVLGVLALLLLLLTGVRNILRQPSAMEKAVAAATVVWAFLFMATAAMRLVAPSFVFGIGFATILSRRPLRWPGLRRRVAEKREAGGSGES